MSSEPLRVLFFVQGRRTPSTRFRVLQLLPALTRLGIIPTVAAPNPSVQGELDGHALHGAWRELARPWSIVSRALQLPLVHEHDVAFVQKPLVNYPFTLFERYVARRRPTVLDLDDAIFHRLAGLECAKTRRLAALSDHIVAGNHYVADFLDAPHKTTIIPTVVDVERYAPRPEPPAPLTLGWTGVASNLRELEPIADVLAAVCRATGGRLRIVAEHCRARFLRALPVDFVPWSPVNEVAALAGVHIGLMPLSDRPFNRGKCGFKLLQYQACAIPVVASPVGANRDIVVDGRTGLLADRPAAWRDALMTLARDPALRGAMGATGRALVVRDYSIAAAAPRLAEVIRRVAR